MKELKFEYKSINENILLFSLSWEVTNDNVIDLFDDIDKIIFEKSIINIIFDFKDINSINSRVAGRIANLYEKLEWFWWNIITINMNDYVDDSLELLWMFLFISKSQNLEEAIILINGN